MRRAGLSADREAQSGAVRIADVDALPVADVDGRHASAIDEYAVEAPVVRRHPAAVVAAQHQVCARNQRARNMHVGLRVASDDDVAVRRERSLRRIRPDGQKRIADHRDGEDVGGWRLRRNGSDARHYRRWQLLRGGMAPEVGQGLHGHGRTPCWCRSQKRIARSYVPLTSGSRLCAQPAQSTIFSFTAFCSRRFPVVSSSPLMLYSINCRGPQPPCRRSLLAPSTGRRRRTGDEGRIRLRVEWSGQLRIRRSSRRG